MQNPLLKTYHRSITGILLTTLCISILSIYYISTYVIEHIAKNEENALSLVLESEAKNKASTLTHWLDSIKNETQKFTNENTLRAYSSRHLIHNQKKENGELPTWAIQDDEKVNTQQRDFIEDNILKFITEQGFSNATIYDAKMQNLLHISEKLPQISPEQNILLRNTLTIKKATYSPIYVGQQGLIINLAYPIFTPDQESKENIPVAVLLLEIPVKEALTRLLSTEKQQNPSTNRLMQWTKESDAILQYIDVRNDSIYSIASWQTKLGAKLPFMERQNPRGNAVYSLGIPLNGYDMLVAYEVPTYFVKDSYSEFSSNIMFMSGISALLVVFITLFGWYFLRLYNEKKLEKKMLMLYDEINTKEQLLNSVNSTLQDGLVLTDSLGNIQYSNTSFANMVHHQVDSLLGYKMINILHSDVANCLQSQINKVINSKSTHIFEEKFTIHNKIYYIQSMCTPYFGMHNEVVGVVSVYRDMTEILLERETEQKRIENLIQAFTRVIELVNPYLGGHSLALATLAVRLAKELKCTLEEEKTLHLAATLSQIGMIGLPRALLNKKEELTDKERRVLYTHTTRASIILKDFDFGLPVQSAIEQMNENMDGSGYPKALQGEEINFLSRILNVANAFCAMLRPRIYRQSKSIEETFAILDKQKDKYDIRVLTVLYAYVASDEGKEFVNTLQSQNTVK